MSQGYDLSPEETLLAALVRLTIRDAKQTSNYRLRSEATWWLWTHAPTVARMAELPAEDRLATESSQ